MLREKNLNYTRLKRTVELGYYYLLTKYWKVEGQYNLVGRLKPEKEYNRSLHITM